MNIINSELAHEIAEVQYMCTSLMIVAGCLLLVTIAECIFDYIEKKKKV